MIDANGYVSRYIPNHHRASTNGMVYEHVLIAEEKLGRELKDEEVVHHINGIRNDNRPENLLVFASNADHSGFHTGCEYKIIEGVAYTNYKESLLGDRRHDKCPMCGKKKCKQSNLCKKCDSLMKTKKAPITRERLKFEIRYFPFVTVGKFHKTSDNMIRRWCKKYNLPYHSNEIRKISDEDWVNI